MLCEKYVDMSLHTKILAIAVSLVSFDADIHWCYKQLQYDYKLLWCVLNMSERKIDHKRSKDEQNFEYYLYKDYVFPPPSVERNHFFNLSQDS